MSLDDLNKKASSRFEELKHKQGWTAERIRNLSQRASVTIDEDKLQRMLDVEPVRTEVEDVVKKKTAEGHQYENASVNPLDFVESLQLPPKVSLAVFKCIMSKTAVDSMNRTQLLREAAQLLMEEING